MPKEGDFKSKLVLGGSAKRGYYWYTDCNEYIHGRWEGFVGFPQGKKKYTTKADALKHKPKR